jgi:hypothetical protein
MVVVFLFFEGDDCMIDCRAQKGQQVEKRATSKGNKGKQGQTRANKGKKGQKRANQRSM